MTQNMERVNLPVAEKPASGTPNGVRPRAEKPLWRRPWIVPLWLVVVGYLAFQLSPFVGTPEAQAPVPPHAGFPAYYPILITHMVFGTIALLTICLQLWPWLRQTRPALHRWSGRVYVVSTVVAGVLALIIVGFAPPVGQIGVSFATLVWMGTAVAGMWAARARKFARHRRYMLYSFAVAMNNVWGVVIVNIGLALPTPPDINYLLEAARWVGWVVNLMLVQWWLNRTADRRVRI
ncbi:DUF2306 domain-containing protein [Actinokineospora sp. 24-640]